MFLTLRHCLPQCEVDAGDFCSDTIGWYSSASLGIRNALKNTCFWELYLSCLGQWLHLPVVPCPPSQKMPGQVFGSNLWHFLLPQSCINQVKLSTCNIIRYLRVFLCTVVCKRVTAFSVFSSYHVSLLEHQKDSPREKSIPLCHSFDTLIHGSYGELTIQGEKNYFCKHACLKQSSCKTQLGFNIHYMYVKLKIKKKKTIPDICWQDLFLCQVWNEWLSAFAHLWSWIIAELFMDCTSADSLLTSHFGRVSN